MNDIIKAMRVLAEELDKQGQVLLDNAKASPAITCELGSAVFAIAAQSEALKDTASRLESEYLDGWIKWDGDIEKAPVNGLVRVKLRDGYISPTNDDPQCLVWDHSNDSGDIIAYKVVK
jgi:hypothetical protein